LSLSPEEAQRRLREAFPVADAELLIHESLKRTERILEQAYLLAFNPLYLARELQWRPGRTEETSPGASSRVSDPGRIGRPILRRLDLFFGDLFDWK
jgi:hypothetical protein